MVGVPHRAPLQTHLVHVGQLRHPDTTQDCWWAYLSGPYRTDRTWGRSLDEAAPTEAPTQLCHLTAPEVDAEHRARVYEAHCVAERVSVLEHESDGSVFAVNFYRH